MIVTVKMNSRRIKRHPRLWSLHGEGLSYVTPRKTFSHRLRGLSRSGREAGSVSSLGYLVLSQSVSHRESRGP
jgi:hypothetical protein